MKKIVLMTAAVLALYACGPNEQQIAAEKCTRALVAAQNFKGYRIKDVQKQINETPSINSVPIIHGQTAIANGTASYGTLVLEVDRPLYSSEQVLMNAPIRNLYCYN